jgi:hypothetical protein
MTCPVAAATTGPSVPTRRRGRRARPGWRARARVAKVSSAAVVAALGMGWTPEVCLSIAITLHPTSAVRTGRIRFRSGWGPGGRRFKSCLPDREIACKSALFSPMAEGAEGGRGTNGEQDLSDVCFGPSRMLVGARLVGHAYRAGRVNTEAHEPTVTRVEWQAANAAPVRAAARGKRPSLLGAACAVRPATTGISGMASSYGVPSYRCRGTDTAGYAPGAGEHQRAQAQELRRGHLALADGR